MAVVRWAISVGALLVLISLTPFEAVSAATLVLKDGTVIQGDIRTLRDDVYTVNTQSLGTVRVPKDNVRTIDYREASAVGSSVGSFGATHLDPSTGSAPGSSGQSPVDSSARSTSGSSQRSLRDAAPSVPLDLQGMQARMIENPNLLAMIQALQSDPEVQAVLADPEIISALAAGNYALLMNNPKIVALTSNGSIREIIEDAQ
jgi:hypothetical protein